MKFLILQIIQSLFNVLGLQVRRKEPGVNFDNALEEQLRLAGPDLKLIVEIGAADGKDTLVYAQKCQSAHVIAFEPLPENWAKLAAVAQNESRIEAVNSAVSDKAGNATFHVTALADASSLLKPMKTDASYGQYVEERGATSVDVVTLDGFFANNSGANIDLLKMDTQGAELNILLGAEELLNAGKIKVVYTEVQFQKIYENSGLYHEIAAFLYEKYFKLHGLYNLINDNNGRLAWGDAIFVRQL